MTRSVWTAIKPPEGTPLDRGHPFAQGLAAFWPLNGGPGVERDVAGMSHLVASAGVTKAAGPHGITDQYVRASSQFRSASNRSNTSTGDIPFTVFAFICPDTVNTRQDWVHRGDGSGAQDEYVLRLESGGAWRFLIRQSDGAYKDAGGATPVAGSWYALFGLHDPVARTITIEVNGVLGTPVATTAGPTAGTGTFYTGGYAGTANFANGRLECAGLWKNRLLLRGERQSIAAQAYTLFAAPPTRRLFVTPPLANFRRTLSGLGARAGSRQIHAGR